MKNLRLILSVPLYLLAILIFMGVTHACGSFPDESGYFVAGYVISKLLFSGLFYLAAEKVRGAK